MGYGVGFMKGITSTLVLSLLMVGCGGDSPQTLTGSFTLFADDIDGDWETCSGTGGYSDFGAGMNVTIRDGDGSIIATSSTRHLTTGDEADEDVEDEDRTALHDAARWAKVSEGLTCVVWFDTEVDDAEFYAVQVGRRGELTYSADELAEDGWNVEMTLGD